MKESYNLNPTVLSDDETEYLVSSLLYYLTYLRPTFEKLKRKNPELISSGLICDNWDIFLTDDILKRLQEDLIEVYHIVQKEREND